MAANADDYDNNDGRDKDDSSFAIKSKRSLGLHQTFDINEGSDITQNVATTLDLLKKQLNSDRSNYIKKKMEENKQKLYIANLHVYNLTKSRRNISDNNSDVNSDLLAMRQYEVLCIGNSFDLPEGDNNNYQEEGSYASSTELIGNNLGGRNEIRPIKLPIVQKLPKYTTWIFLDRNQKMAEDQLVVGRRRINYDQIGGQALINSDNEDDVIDDEEDKKRFTSADDYIIRMTIQQEGLTDVVLNSLSQCLEKNSDEIMVRYEILQERDKDEEHVNDEMKAKTKIEDEFLDKDLGTALDSFDSLFCRRCLVFDCRLHGCSQDLVLPVEKQHPWNNNTDDGIPCGVHCYKLAPQPYMCTGENSYKLANNDGISWKAIEQSLFAKGLEIFDRNSCLISRNLLNGLKTCKEVFHRMNSSQSNGPYKVDGTSSLVEGDNDFNGIMGTKLHTKSKSLRRRGRVRRLKYTWKSAGYHSIRKRISDKKDEPCRQYNPCGCQYACGKQCPCLLNGTCCEKYCGCPKICKNRFRGCHCAKSQCRSRQCPCFATNRECDPDVCRNCWISCGDGTLGAPNQRGDNSDCQNMKLLLKQQQRVLLGRSDVAGWGAFIKNTVSKHEYLGEYTGELITHQEADIRDSSFLFNLNDQLVIDAHRKGNKLKFANHSPRPNCYAKVTMVAGDHKVGIFAKERICAGEELFYDYRYEPDEAPAWARKPESSGSKKGDSRPSISRAKKLA